MTVKEKVFKAVAEEACIPVKGLTLDTKIMDIMDSLTAVSLMIVLEIDDESEIETIGDIVKYLGGQDEDTK